jgi:hypothetical protein
VVISTIELCPRKVACRGQGGLRRCGGRVGRGRRAPAACPYKCLCPPCARPAVLLRAPPVASAEAGGVVSRQQGVLESLGGT